MIGWIILGLVVAAAVYAVAIYNGLVKNRQMVEEGWSGIDVQLKRRTDLIPNLLETVKGYMSHERETLEAVTNARAAATSAANGTPEQRAAAEGQLSAALGRLIATAEAYPDLKANTTFLEFQAALQTVEDEIQMSRRYYNGAVRNLNVMVESVPSNFIAGPFGFQKAEYFELENEADRAVPTVKFDFAAMRALFRSVIALLLGLLLVLPAAAREEIRSYDSNIVLAIDGSVSVTETITVNAEGNEIRRGIYRDIPVVMAGSDGGKVRPGFEVTGVTRDGDQEMYRVERMGNFQRIWIGNPDYFLDHGVHTFTIRYTMTRMARAFEDHDELYWNVTGNYWVFPILSARATVTLPNGAVITELAGYTGVVGSTEQAVAVKRTSNTSATFRASRALGAGEGMTIAVAFDKGIIAYPSGFAAFMQRLSDLRETIIPVLAALFAVAYNALAWFRVGRDPDKGTIIPLFHAPKGFSPPLVHYIHKWGFGDMGWTALTSAIFDLGVKGLVTIDNSTGALSIKVTGKQPEEPLSSSENIIFSYLESKRTTVIGKANGPDLQKRRAEFTTAIETENRALWFKNNTGYSVLGYALAIALLAGMVFTEILDPVWLIGSVIIGILLATVARFATKGFAGASMLPRLIGGVWVAIVGFNVFGFAIDSLTSISINVASIAAISIVVVTIVFTVLMRAPTLQGRKVMDQIDGLKLYLETAEKDRMNMAEAPPMTATRFERLLPYAIALGVEKPWSQHFEAELARHAVSDVSGSSYSPSWYHSGSGRSVGSSASSMTIAVSAAAASMTAAMVAAQPVQASSSGFSSGGGGGGSSGGGGGGGGGGGW